MATEYRLVWKAANGTTQTSLPLPLEKCRAFVMAPIWESMHIESREISGWTKLEDTMNHDSDGGNAIKDEEPLRTLSLGQAVDIALTRAADEIDRLLEGLVDVGCVWCQTTLGKFPRSSNQGSEASKLHVESCEKAPQFQMKKRIEELESENRDLRRLLFLTHSCEGTYGDDGEMQCSLCRIDFKRDAVGYIDLRIQERGLQRLKGETNDHH